MKKILLTFMLLAVSICLLSGCSSGEASPSSSDTDAGDEVVGTSDNNEDTSSAKMKTRVDDAGRIEVKGDQLKDISALSIPVGVSDVKITTEKDSIGGDDYYLEGVIYKNSDNPTSGDIILNFLVYDKDQKRIREVVVIEEALLFEDTVEFKEYISILSDDNPPVSYELILVREANHETEIENDEVEAASYQINAALENGEYNLAKSILDELLEKYPDNKTLKRLEATYKDAVAKNAAEIEQPALE